ncbi:hypothetical protein [Bilophila wadsworthia]
MAINLKNMFGNLTATPTGSGGKRVSTLPFFIFVSLLLVVAGVSIFYLTASSTSQGRGTARVVRQQAMEEVSHPWPPQHPSVERSLSFRTDSEPTSCQPTRTLSMLAPEELELRDETTVVRKLPKEGSGKEAITINLENYTITITRRD